MEALQQFFVQLRAWLDIPLIPIGGTSLTLWMVLYLLVLIALLIYVTGKLRAWMVERLLARTRIDIGVRQAVGSIFRYVIVAIGFMIILQTAGINLSALTVLAGALGIGVGFGLQNITNNFVSGLIILFERPIKVGDRIDVGNVTGDVVRISPRATTIVTNDNIAVIVPNSEFISSQVINWSYTNRDVRLNFPVGVAYHSDPDLVRKALLEVAADHPGVLKDRNADVLLQEFGDSSLNFMLRVWTRDYATTPGVLRSELNYAICKKFKEHGIEIPFPQRDLHIRSGAVEVKMAPVRNLS
jgi:small-conductance mechanosensitive channel